VASLLQGLRAVDLAVLNYLLDRCAWQCQSCRSQQQKGETMAFERHTARKRYAPPRRIATINGRPAWQVVDERRAAECDGMCDPAPACGRKV